MASYGRQVRKAGLKLLLSSRTRTSTRPRRGSSRGAAGSRSARRGRSPTSSLGALFSLCCLALPAGRRARHLLPARVRRLPRRVLQPEPVRRSRRLPDPRRRAARTGPAAAGSRTAHAAAQRTTARRDDSPALARYAVFGVVWSAVAACFAVGMSLRYEPHLAQFAPDAGRMGEPGRRCGLDSSCRCSSCWPGRCASGGAAGRREVSWNPRPTPPRACSSACSPIRASGRASGGTRSRASREAGLDSVADEMALSGGKAMDTLDVRESRSSLAGVFMAAALEGVGPIDFSKDLAAPPRADPRHCRAGPLARQPAGDPDARRASAWRRSAGRGTVRRPARAAPRPGPGAGEFRASPPGPGSARRQRIARRDRDPGGEVPSRRRSRCSTTSA